MKIRSLRGVAITAMTGFVLALRAQDTTIDQSQFPVILQQPADQCVPAGSPVTFSVVATNVDSYQWYKNNTPIDGQTNSNLTIANAAISDVGYYSAAAMKGFESVPTRMANFTVYTTSGSKSSQTTTRNRFGTMSTAGMMSTMDTGGSGGMTLWGTPVCGNGGSGSGCPGRYAGYVAFSKTVGYGWAPTTGTTIHTATDNNRTDTKVYFQGQWGDAGCNTNSVAVANPMSQLYRFTIFFPTNTVVPTNIYPITLEGFDP